MIESDDQIDLVIFGNEVISMDSTSALILAFTIIFSPFASIIAYLITYDEYQHHLERPQARNRAIQAAIFTLVVFFAVGLISGNVFRKINGLQ